MTQPRTRRGMEGDVIRAVREEAAWIGHFHTSLLRDAAERCDV